MICVAVDAKGWPVTWVVFPGNTADIEAFKHIEARMKQRFPIGKVVVVAGRAMLSAKTLQLMAEDNEAHLTTSWAASCARTKRCGDQILFNFETAEEEFVVYR